MNSAITFPRRSITWRGSCSLTRRRGLNSGSGSSSRSRRPCFLRASACSGAIGCVAFAVRELHPGKLFPCTDLKRRICMRALRLAFIIVIIMLTSSAVGHVGSPNVYLEGDAGPYHLLVTVNPPAMVPGIAEVQVRVTSGAVGSISITPVYVNGKD